MLLGLWLELQSLPTLLRLFAHRCHRSLIKYNVSLTLMLCKDKTELSFKIGDTLFIDAPNTNNPMCALASPSSEIWCLTIAFSTNSSNLLRWCLTQPTILLGGMDSYVKMVSSFKQGSSLAPTCMSTEGAIAISANTRKPQSKRFLRNVMASSAPRTCTASLPNPKCQRKTGILDLSIILR